MKICKVFQPCDQGRDCCCAYCDEPDRVGCICSGVEDGANGVCQHLGRYKNYRYIYTALLCIVVTALCCYAAYKVRGYMAVGGEWLVWLPIAALGMEGEEKRDEV